MFHPYTALMSLPAGAVGQGPAFLIGESELVAGLQTFDDDLARSIATNLAAMIWTGGPRDFTAYSPGSYEVNFGEPSSTAPGYPAQAMAPGAYILVAPSSVAPVDALFQATPLDKISVFVAENKEAAGLSGLAAPGGNYGVVQVNAGAAPAVEKKGPSTTAIVAGLAAAAVAALLIFA